MNRALFINLDGTLIHTKSGEHFPVNYDDWQFTSGILPRIKTYHLKGFIPVIISNQGGIVSGRVDAELFDQKADRIRDELAQYLRTFVNIIYCPFMDNDNYYKMPNPGMAFTVALKLELLLRESVMVGNSDKHSKFVKNAYIGTYYDLEHFLKLEIDDRY